MHDPLLSGHVVAELLVLLFPPFFEGERLGLFGGGPVFLVFLFCVVFLAKGSLSRLSWSIVWLLLMYVGLFWPWLISFGFPVVDGHVDFLSEQRAAVSIVHLGLHSHYTSFHDKMLLPKHCVH